MKLNILFTINKHKINQKGFCGLTCRLTYMKKRKQFSTGLFINPSHWKSKQQLIVPPEPDAELINTQLSLIKTKLSQAFLFLQVNGNPFDVEDIYLQFKGENIKTEKTLLEVFKMHNEHMLNLVGKDYTKSTYSKFIEASSHTKNFIKFTYKKNDFMLSNLSMKFLNDFDYYLKSEKNHKQITINKTIQRLRKIIKLAMAEAFILTDPFLMYRPKKFVTKVVFLSADELELMMAYNFSQPRLQQVKDMFIFCCFTGLPYAEMRDLRKEHIVNGFDGGKWIKMHRQKTSKELNIPLMPDAKTILDKYQYQLPLITNQKFNSYLKEIADILGIEKRLTHHIARKTFASTVLLYNDVPMEIVSELLGHSCMKITQDSYGKIVQRKISQEMKKLKGR
ncbi:site-specific integrase [Flavobacteriaceae bacterium S0862]|nr:site-specific integrase [Flavobacteriaceae bacterium S0862]